MALMRTIFNFNPNRADYEPIPDPKASSTTPYVPPSSSEGYQQQASQNGSNPPVEPALRGFKR